MAKEPDLRAIEAWSYYREILNRSEIARRLGITPVAVHNWRVVPEARLQAVSDILGIPAKRLRPDLDPVEAPWNEI